MHAHCQNSICQELIWVLSWNFQRMLTGEDLLTKSQYVHTTANTTTTTNSTTTSNAATCRAESIEINISRSIRTYRLSKGHASWSSWTFLYQVETFFDCIKLKLLGLDMRNVLLTKRQNINTTAVRSTIAIQYYY